MAKMKKNTASKTVSKASALKKVAKTKGKKDKKKSGEEFDDELLAGEEVGSEEIPDLSEFEETEEETAAEETGDEEASEEALEVKAPSDDDEIILTDAEGRRLCRVRECDQAASVELYCRYHYLALWKKIQVRRKILQDGKLERYVDELTSRYPDKFLEMIKKDLRTEKDFLTAIAELEIDESSIENEFEDEAQSFVDEIRGVSDTGSISEEDEF